MNIAQSLILLVVQIITASWNRSKNPAPQSLTHIIRSLLYSNQQLSHRENQVALYKQALQPVGQVPRDELVYCTGFTPVKIYSDTNSGHNYHQFWTIISPNVLRPAISFFVHRENLKSNSSRVLISWKYLPQQLSVWGKVSSWNPTRQALPS